jgi:hypothetical protein
MALTSGVIADKAVPAAGMPPVGVFQLILVLL